MHPQLLTNLQHFHYILHFHNLHINNHNLNNVYLDILYLASIPNLQCL